jgi:hypothetical protein
MLRVFDSVCPNEPIRTPSHPLGLQRRAQGRKGGRMTRRRAPLLQSNVGGEALGASLGVLYEGHTFLSLRISRGVIQSGARQLPFWSPSMHPDVAVLADQYNGSVRS